MPLADTKFELCHDVEQVLKIGRDFQKQDSWRGAHHDTAKLLCDTIEYLYKRLPQPDPDWKTICEKCHDGDIEPECEYYGEPNGCNSPIYGEHPKSQPMREAMNVVHKIAATAKSDFDVFAGIERIRRISMSALSASAVDCPPSNVAALRDALTPWVALGEWLIENAGKEALGRGIAEIVPTLRKRIDESKAALAAPPRQCDVGTAEEQSGRMEKSVCSKHNGCVRCPIHSAKYSDCSLAWAQTPYEAEEGGAAQ